MSASPIARQLTHSQAIPTRSIVINDPSQLPIDYSSTPGGTLYSTTPGGTRIVYDRSFLMQLRNSPIAKTPPKNMANVPCIFKNADLAKDCLKLSTSPTIKAEENSDELQDQFQLEI